MNKKLAVLIILLITLSACSPQVIEEPESVEEVEEVEEVVEEEEKEPLLSPEEIAQELLGGKGQILNSKRVFDEDQPYLELLVEEERGFFIYCIDPEEKEIISREELQIEHLGLEEILHRSRQVLPGADDIQALVLTGRFYELVLLEGEDAYGVKLDAYSLEAELLGPVEVEEIDGSFNLNLFDAVEKFQVINGPIDVEKLYYAPGDIYSAWIILEGYIEEGGERVFKSYKIDSHNGVIIET